MERSHGARALRRLAGDVLLRWRERTDCSDSGIPEGRSRSLVDVTGHGELRVAVGSVLWGVFASRFYGFVLSMHPFDLLGRPIGMECAW